MEKLAIIKYLFFVPCYKHVQFLIYKFDSADTSSCSPSAVSALLLLMSLCVLNASYLLTEFNTHYRLQGTFSLSFVNLFFFFASVSTIR